jgi:hypothetical protein
VYRMSIASRFFELLQRRRQELGLATTEGTEDLDRGLLVALVDRRSVAAHACWRRQTESDQEDSPSPFHRTVTSKRRSWAYRSSKTTGPPNRRWVSWARA